MRLSFLIAIAFVLTQSYVYGLPCREGTCCENGNILPNGTVCRQALDGCDVTEYCTGSSSDCPPNRFAENYETFCKFGLDMGVCENGTCMTEEVIVSNELCAEKCSSERGTCTLRGLCVCNHGWQSPPTCDKKALEENGEKDMGPNTPELKLEEQDEQVLDRTRREVEANDRSRISYIESETTEEESEKMLSIQDAPQKGTFTRLKENSLFIPAVVILVVFIILIAFIISASIFYQSQLKSQEIQKRIKVDKTTSEIPKNVSKIDDPTINIDVGR